MTALCFVDTNVLLYQKDRLAETKQAVATDWMAQLWREGSGRLSYQVLVEYYANVLRVDRQGSRDDARADVTDLLQWQPLPVDARVIAGAWRLRDQGGLSWWDALIVSAAQVAECPYLLSEDLQDGQRFGGVTVLDPFSHHPSEASE